VAIAESVDTRLSNQSLLQKAETGNVTPARDPALREAKAGVYGEKAGFLLSQE